MMANKLVRVGALAGALLASPAIGRTAPPKEPRGAATPAAPANAAGTVASAATAQSDAAVILMLVRTTLVALHQANMTGNYTVLRDIAAPDFHDHNSAADLARIFGPIRDKHIDLAEAVLLDPHISDLKVLPNKLLHVSGWLATRPTPIAFEFLFQPIAGTWRLYGIAVDPARQVP
jgi:hypothetical protein